MHTSGTTARPTRAILTRGGKTATGDVGESVLRGLGVFTGYWNNTDATAAAIRHGWFHTSDLARDGGDGYYSLVDRKMDMVITAVENVNPIEVEQVIDDHREVSEVAVIGAPDTAWGEAVVASVVFKTPKRIFFIEELLRP